MSKAKKYPDEFREEAVKLAFAGRLSGKSVTVTAAELGVHKQTLYNWMHEAEIEAGDRDGLSKAERAELVQLRKRVKQLEQEREILGKATAFFASEGKYSR